jgi:hypothetical protein
MKNCEKTSKDQLFTFSEKRSTLILENINKVDSTVITVDDCAIIDGIRCDYLHIAKNIEMYIELKGQDISHAIDQIERTIKMLSKNKESHSKVSYIICTRCPISSTEIQHYAWRFRKKYNSKLIIKSSPYKDSY